MSKKIATFVIAGTACGLATAQSDLDLEWGPLLRARRDPQLRRFLGAELPRIAQALAQAQNGGAPGSVLAGLASRLDEVEQELALLALAEGGLLGRG